MKKAGIDHTVLNADATRTKTYWKWERLYENFQMFKDAVDGNSSLYYELAEQIVDLKPDTVIVGSGDIILSYVCLGNPYSGANLASVLKKAGIKRVLGFGQYVTMWEKWKSYKGYDGILINGPSEKIVDVVCGDNKGVIDLGRFEPNVIPNFDDLVPSNQTSDVVISSVGCKFRCEFCLARKLMPDMKFANVDLFLDDVESRNKKKIFIGDTIFTIDKNRLMEICRRKEERKMNFEFVCESRVDTLTDEVCVTLKKMGCVAVKIGVESVSQVALEGMGKKTDREKCNTAVVLLKKHGIGIIVYAMLGGPGCTNETVEETYNWIKSIEPDWVVVSVWSDDLGSDPKYDAHFNPTGLKKWDVDESWFFKMLELRKNSDVSKVSNLIG
ncbi:MAG: radical SAM protein [Nitrospirae bacterium]|nr:radical SAM protein [Nitrospirota bacterium]